VPKTILIVDDSAPMRQALSRLFHAAAGFRICGEASNGTEAIKLVQKLKPDLVVLDLCMPGMNGLETARALKDLEMDARILLYTMNAEEIIAKDAYAAGVHALVSKAEGIKVLIDKARTVLHQSVA